MAQVWARGNFLQQNFQQQNNNNNNNNDNCHSINNNAYTWPRELLILKLKTRLVLIDFEQRMLKEKRVVLKHDRKFHILTELISKSIFGFTRWLIAIGLNDNSGI